MWDCVVGCLFSLSRKKNTQHKHQKKVKKKDLALYTIQFYFLAVAHQQATNKKNNGMYVFD